MRLLFFLLLWCSTAAAGPLRIVTWNLQWFPGRKPAPDAGAPTEHMAEVQAALKVMQPDVLVLQEVASEAAVAEAVSVLPGFKVAIVSRFKNDAGFIEAQQIAICSRFPARFVHSARWEKGWAGAPRGFAFASLECEGGPLNIYGLHLKSNLGNPQINTAKREDSVEQLLAHMEGTRKDDPSAGSRWVVCGDFNTDSVNEAVPSERTFPLMAEAGFHWSFDGIAKAQRITCPAKGQYPDACFDHFFTSGLGKPLARPLSEILGSDHLPVALDFDLGNDHGPRSKTN